MRAGPGTGPAAAAPETDPAGAAADQEPAAVVRVAEERGEMAQAQMARKAWGRSYPDW